MTKKEYDKAYSLENKKKRNEVSRLWYLKNKDKKKAYRDAKKSRMYSVYYIQKENYIGVTNRYEYRIKEHSRDGRDTSNCIEIKKYDTKREALDTEAYYHSIGYEGRNKWVDTKKRK